MSTEPEASLRAVGAERDAVDRGAVAGALAQLLAVGGVPELDELVVAAGRQQVALGAVGHRVDDVLVGLLDGARRCVPFSTSQIRNVLSAAPVAACLPSGLQATL